MEGRFEKYNLVFYHTLVVDGEIINLEEPQKVGYIINLDMKKILMKKSWTKRLYRIW